MNKYALRYDLKLIAGEFSKEDIDQNETGLADALVVLSMLYPDDGSFSLGIVSLDGRTNKPVSSTELFKVWTMIAKQLSETNELSDARRQITRLAFEVVRDAIVRKH